MGDGIDMGLRFKFNLVLAVVFVIAFAALGFTSRQMLQDNAREEVLRQARLLMNTALAVRTYTAEQVKPHFDKQLQDVFWPQSVPSYAATDILNQLQQPYPGYSYKEATLNPTNPRDRATDWEADIVQQFRHNPESTELVSERSVGTGRNLYIARPIQISSPACLQCHSVPAAAPDSMLKIYGEANGFGWKFKEIVGARVVTVPMDTAILRADRAFTTFMASLAAVFLAVLVVLNLLLSGLVSRPASRMSAAADQTSQSGF
jgi:hypothetical protein